MAENMLEGSNLNKQFVNLSRSDTKKDGGIGMIVKVGQWIWCKLGCSKKVLWVNENAV